jgi:N-ethylmaleimide reductase
MAPMVRYRGNHDGTASDLIAEYFAQRASAGLIVCEGGYVHPSGRLAPQAGGIVTSAQIESWRKVTDAVHAKGGRIFLQLIHSGRHSHPLLQEDGGAPWAPSAVQPKDDLVRAHTDAFETTPPPRAISGNEIGMLIGCYAAATANAAEAGFDGVELHAGNGYLPHQFLASNTNLRTDRYGGSLANRCRFVLEALESMVAVKGAEFVGLKVSPVTTHHDTQDADPAETYTYLYPQLKSLGPLAYLTVQSTMNFVQPEPPLFDVFLHARPLYHGTLFAAANMDRYAGEGVIASGTADAAVYGRRFVANPDLVERFRAGAQENIMNWATASTGGAAYGYTDYPKLKN